VLSDLINMQFFDVHANQLTGTIPDLTGLDVLSAFYVGVNQLTGTVPPAPSSLMHATLCPNPLDTTAQASIDPAWNAATGFAPWRENPFSNNNCDDLFSGGFDA